MLFPTLDESTSNKIDAQVLESLSVCPSVRPSIHPSIYGSTDLCWVLAAFQFFNPTHSRLDCFARASARRKAATYS
jgi:hypothetical protein